jgi:hypothetical protein
MEDNMVLGIESLPPREALWQLVTATWIAHPVRAMAVLGIADHLAEGSRTVAELAEATGTNPSALARLLGTLAALGLCAEDGPGKFRLKPIGEFLRADVPGSAQPFAVGMMAPYVERAWHELPEAIRTGQPVFPHVHGLGYWDYLAAHPEEGARFDAAMSGGAERAQTLMAVRDLSELGTLVDIGGGQGLLLATALAAFPNLRGVLFDRPDVLSGAEAILAGVRDRCDLVGGDFFEAVPAGGDAYVLASTIHDWQDEQAVAILRTCHRAMAPGARIWLIERVLTPDCSDYFTRLHDLLLLVLFGARERTVDEYCALLETAGFTEINVHTGELPWGVIEAVQV